MTITILDKIKHYKLEEVAADKAVRPLSEIEAEARNADPVRPFGAALRKASETGYGLIAEVKKASPSKGLIREDFHPATLAAAYERGGATCLSVLTDTPSFQGAKSFLTEARALGADCILIIMASVSDTLAAELEDAASSWGMDALIEVHDADELERALKLKSPLIGINNRNLKTFELTLDTTRELSKRVPEGRMLVCESGLYTPADLADMAGYGARSFLIGESLMRQDDVEDATRTLLSDPVPA